MTLVTMVKLTLSSQERDQMAPDAVKYARALRPPYHLVSFLR